MFSIRLLLPLAGLVSSLMLAGCSIDNPAAAATATSHTAERNAIAPMDYDDDMPAPNRSPSRASAAASSSGGVNFMRYEVVDQRMNGMVANVIAVPQGWKTQSSIEWDMTNGNNPTRGHMRFEAPDHSAWVESFPIEIFSWVSVDLLRQPIGSRRFGTIHYPHITIEEALRRFVIGQYRGNKKNLQIVGSKGIPNLAQSMWHQDMQGDSLMVRVRYEDNGQQVDEDFYAFLGAQQNIPSDSPQGRIWEYHRGMYMVHSMGARRGNLDNVYPLLNSIVASNTSNPAWQEARKQVMIQIGQNFARHMANTYAQIADAGRRSAATTRQSEAWLKSFDANYVASNNARNAARAASAPSSNNDGFTVDDYIRGTERMVDPTSSTGESTQSYNNAYHWVDASGNHQNTNDPSFNPNIGSNQNWTLMDRVGQH